MTHYYEKNIVEIKDEYTAFLTDIMTPLMYEGIKSIYGKAVDYEKMYEKAAMNNPEVEQPGVLRIFQHLLKGVPNLSNSRIDAEVTRIRDNSKYADIFESLIKAVVKSNIILLTFNASGKKCRLINEKIHEKTDIRLFVHKCYIECAKQFYNYPELFWHEYTTLEVKRNQREIHKLVEESIIKAIRRTLPMKQIIDEYLQNDYVVEADEDDDDKKYTKLKNLLSDENKINAYDDGQKIFMSETDEISDDIGELESNMDYLDKLIYDRPTVDTTNSGVIEEHMDEKTGVKLEQKDIFVPSAKSTAVDHEVEKENKAEQKKDEGDIVKVNRMSDKDIQRVGSDGEYIKKVNSGEYVVDLTSLSKNKQIKKAEAEDININRTDDKNMFFSTMFNR